MNEDVYFKKIVALQQDDRALQFRVAQDLFSSHAVDTGTRRLLRTLVQGNRLRFTKTLDLGCGYGALGLVLKSLDPKCVVHMVDRDALALEYARQNAELNGLQGLEIYGSLGYDDVSSSDFDLVVCNIPGKAGISAISHFLRDGCHCLKPGGLMAVVVVAPLADVVAEILDNPHISILTRKTWSRHTVFRYRFLPQFCDSARLALGGFQRGIYHRAEAMVSVGDLEFSMQTAYGLPEFDTLSYRTALLVEGVCRLQGSAVRRAVLLNPGQGHVPVVIWRLLRPDTIALVDRDLLSLRYSRHNLVLNGCAADAITISHQVGVKARDQQSVDLVVGTLREQEGPQAAVMTIRQAAEQLSPDGNILIAASSSAVTRLETAIRSEKLLRVTKRKRHKGNSFLLLGPRANQPVNGNGSPQRSRTGF